MTYVLGVDIGGTFTDVALVDVETGEQSFYKTDSTPSDSADGVAHGICDLLRAEARTPEDCVAFVHGTTLALNAVLTRTGAQLGMLVTRGFRDILEIGRLAMPDPFHLYTQKSEPLLRKYFVAEVDERILGDGSTEQALDEDSLAESVAALIKKRVEALVVCFLNSYRDPSHERRARDWLREHHPEIPVWLSSDVWPEIREYERALVTVMNGYVAPKVTRYLRSLKTQMRDVGLDVPLTISTSNGGVLHAELIADRPGSTILSGPAAGVIAAARVAEACGADRVLALDMGGTSADFSVITDWQIPYSTMTMVGGFPLILPSVDIVSVGAGGGSIARLDNLGILKVGPESAGSVPGPACYGRGGTSATVTDAYVVCGWLDSERFLGGRLSLDSEAALSAIAALAGEAGYSPDEVAEGILRVATANLTVGIGRAESSKGIDVRDYSLLAYGGAGPTQACMLAETIGVRRILVPPSPGTLCALGAISADYRLDFVRTYHTLLDEVELADVQTWFADRELEARASLDAERGRISGLVPLRSAELRYQGQGFNLEVQLDESIVPARDRLGIADAFHSRYQDVYGTADRSAPVEFMNARLTMVGVTQGAPLQKLEAKNGARRPALRERRVLMSGDWTSAPVLDRADLGAGFAGRGPCLIDQEDTTVVVAPNWSLSVDDYGVIHLEKGM